METSAGKQTKLEKSPNGKKNVFLRKQLSQNTLLEYQRNILANKKIDHDTVDNFFSP